MGPIRADHAERVMVCSARTGGISRIPRYLRACAVSSVSPHYSRGCGTEVCRTGDAELASQPMLSRLENAVDRRACAQLADELLDIYPRAREQARTICGRVTTPLSPTPIKFVRFVLRTSARHA